MFSAARYRMSLFTKPVIISLIAVSAMIAQTGTQEAGLGAINGVITDTTGLVVPDVTVTAVNINTGAQRVVTTSTLGFIRFRPCRRGDTESAPRSPGLELKCARMSPSKCSRSFR